ncbi:hypothetical protein AK812_SmicGene26719 [Symbiodinium microadriaticum]|uniref:Uncharacterized protein n=1 Tax=Symbiodinium microadriaticum TaxID=2951 RepID=A0A1Q9D8P1_SYMMI|nr:hypothetical protein AK812_SmicGene26719 [Symbiodinium microadriaticum]
MSKAVLQAKLRIHGEEPPEKWTVVELRARLAEVEPSLLEPSTTSSNRTELQNWVHRINKARVKKANLISLCQDEMGIEVSGTETIPVLERKALLRAHSLATPMARDLVGFGKHAALEYQDINRYQRSYREWILKTDSEESGCDYRLRRLAQWLRENPVVDEEIVETHKLKPTRKKGPSSLASNEPAPSLAISNVAASSSAAPATVDKDMVAILQNLTAAMQNLQEKVTDLEEGRERPRKKDNSKEMSTTGSSETTSEGYLKIKDLVGHTGAAKQPGLVWLAPSDTPFSPLQHANMRSDAQKEELKQKRAQAPEAEVLEPESDIEESYSAQEVIAAEEKAKKLITQQDYSEAACLDLIRTMPVRAHVTRAGKLGSEKHQYHLFGAYAHGAQYGVSNRTKQLTQCARYLNMFVKQKVPGHRRWTSLVLSMNNSMPLHRDVNNEANQPNMVVGLGDYTGQAPDETGEQKLKRLMPNGTHDKGRQLVKCCVEQLRRNWYLTGPPKEEAGEQWWDKVPEEAWYCSEQAYWSDSTAGVQVEVDLPHTTSGWNKALQNFEGYLVGAMRRRAVEVREKQLSEEEKLAFQGAKAVEVKNFVAARAFEVLPEHLRQVRQMLLQQAARRNWTVFKGQLRGMISGHVDDFLFGGSEQDVQWQEILTKIKSRFQWGDWERDTEGFTQCGVRIIRTEEGYELSQPQFVEALKEIPLNASRRKDRREKTTEREKTQLRALLGSLSWLAQQSSPHLSASVSLLLSEVSTSTVDTIVRTNVLTSQVKKRKEHKMLIHSFPAGEPLVLYSWVDAAPANRPDGGSTQGIFKGIGPESVLHGAVDRISPIAWHSSKVDRVCRSPGAAEAQAAVNGEDSLYYARYQWSELEFGDVDPRAAQEVVRRVPGCLITDSRNVYDKLNTEVLIVKGAEKRTDLEMMGLKESQQNTELSIRWVHSEAQLANSLTKLGGGKEIETYYQMGYQWRIVEDAQMRSARKRKQVAKLRDYLVEKYENLEDAYDAFEQKMPPPDMGGTDLSQIPEKKRKRREGRGLSGNDFVNCCRMCNFKGRFDPRLLFNFLDASHVGHITRNEFLQLGKLGAVEALRISSERMRNGISTLKHFIFHEVELEEPDTPQEDDKWKWAGVHKALREVTQDDLELAE